MKTAYPQTQNTCSIRLYSNIPFDNTYKNHSLISNLFKYNGVSLYQKSTARYKPCEQFIDRQDYTQQYYPYVYPRYDMTGEFNFDFKNGLIGSVTLELTPEQTNANYMRLTCGNDVYYYFITAITQDNFNTYTLSLELDVLMTYQDEFLNGMQDKPVFTTRKHSHRYVGTGSTTPYCCDLKTGDDTFAGVKPNILVKKLNLTFNDYPAVIDGLMWLYVCVDPRGDDLEFEKFVYNYNNKKFPLTMVAIPLLSEELNGYDTSGGIEYRYLDGQTYSARVFTHTELERSIFDVINDGSAYGSKISPYPPFKLDLDSSVYIDETNHRLVISTENGGAITETKYFDKYGFRYMNIGNNQLVYAPNLYTDYTGCLLKLCRNGGLIVVKQNDIDYELSGLNNSNLDIVASTLPTILTNRTKDPKLKFAPFRKYVLNSQYCSEGWEFHPELMLCEYNTNSNSYYYRFKSIATSYIGDNNFYTFLYAPQSSGIKTFDNYRYEKIGLANNINYVFPCGTNALDVFNSTQAQSFYQSKTASGITSFLTMGGGVASIILGGLGAIPSAGASTSLIAGGVTAIAGGTASLVNTFKSTSAKIEDLKNTPDSINISGSNYITDDAIAEGTNALPYVVIYEVSNIIKENADEYFYNYGYQVSRDCYFNTELKVTAPSTNYIDENLFGRTIFNYVQINEDITNKIDANIPLIVKQKLSNIFNQGITLWTFFGLEPYTNVIPTASYYLDRWFMKNNLDNAEYR